jgi:hypothetical protein
VKKRQRCNISPLRDGRLPLENVSGFRADRRSRVTTSALTPDRAGQLAGDICCGAAPVRRSRLRTPNLQLPTTNEECEGCIGSWNWKLGIGSGSLRCLPLAKSRKSTPRIRSSRRGRATQCGAAEWRLYRGRCPARGGAEPLSQLRALRLTSRALPDVRDGLKPVQRRILYTMWQQNLTADAKHRSAPRSVGDVMGSYTRTATPRSTKRSVRMAQPVLAAIPAGRRLGEFGSLDGDSAAAMRYTECRLARVSDEMLEEIDQATGPLPSRTTTARRPSRSSFRRACRICWSMARRALRSGWPRTFRHITSARCARR